jgi:hypothetical protein
MKYTCATCGVPTIVLNDGKDIIRPCEHTEAGVVAHCDAVCTGEASVSAE